MPMPPTVPPMIWLRAGLLVEDAAGVDGRDDPCDADQPEVRVDADLGELRGERACAAAPPSRLAGSPLAVGGQFGQSVPGEDVGVGLTRRRAVADRGCRRPAAVHVLGRRSRAAASRLVVGDEVDERPQQLPAGVRAPRCRATRSARSRPSSGASGMVAVAELEADLVERQAERSAGELGHDRVGAGAEVGGGAAHDRGPVPAERRRGLAGRLDLAVEADAGHPVADQPSGRRASSATRGCGAPSRSAPRRPRSTRAAPCSTTAGPSAGEPRRSCAAAARPGRCPARRPARRARIPARSCPGLARGRASSRGRECSAAPAGVRRDVRAGVDDARWPAVTADAP